MASGQCYKENMLNELTLNQTILFEYLLYETMGVN